MEMKHQKFKECNIDLHKWGIRCSVGYPAVLEILMEKKCFSILSYSFYSFSFCKLV